MRILLIDDQPENVQSVLDEIMQKLAGSDCKVVDFGKPEADIESHNPHIIILDLLQGTGAERKEVGIATGTYIWGTRFCPLIYYTAAPDLVAEQSAAKHPFIKVVKKGADSEALVLQCIQEFEPHIRALDGVETEIRSAMNGALLEIAPRLFETATDETERNEMLVRSARRRVAARMDEDLLTGSAASKGLKSWECFLFPPVAKHLLMGDVIRRRNADGKVAANYGVILTPSCDLVKTATRKPKVTRVLVSCCTTGERLLQDLNIQKWKKDDRDKLKRLLTTGYSQSCMPLPGLPGVFPAMTIDFRSLQLIDIESIGNPDAEYERVASVDNPWRELLAWAFMLSSARPGMPDRDCETWADEIIALFPTATS